MRSLHCSRQRVMALPYAAISGDSPGSASIRLRPVREARLLADAPWVRSLGKLSMEVTTEGWRFPAPPEANPAVPKPRLYEPEARPEVAPERPRPGKTTRLKPPRDTTFSASPT